MAERKFMNKKKQQPATEHTELLREEKRTTDEMPTFGTRATVSVLLLYL
jgi:hypothetical protein